MQVEGEESIANLGVNPRRELLHRNMEISIAFGKDLERETQAYSQISPQNTFCILGRHGIEG
jgi:hypothetical protein